MGKCKKCGREIENKRILKTYPDRNRVWCVCGYENYFYFNQNKNLKQNKKENKEVK